MTVEPMPPDELGAPVEPVAVLEPDVAPVVLLIKGVVSGVPVKKLFENI
jgi:hypothetical protein